MSKTRKRMLGFGLVVVLLVAAGIGVVLSRRQQPSTPDPDARAKTLAKPVPATAPTAPRAQSRFYAPPRSTPDELRGFTELSQTQRLNLVTEMMDDRQLPPPIVNFFKTEIFNRTHWDVTRNNLANALVWQEKPDRNLHKLFIQMLEDEDEDPVWRDYCLQFLSECLPSSAEPDLIKSKLHEYSQKSGTNMAGTATVHLAYQEGLGRVKLAAEFSEQLASQLRSPEVTDATKLSILGVAGKRQDQRLLPLVREYAKQDTNDSLKRTAIASLGLIGDPADLELIRSGLNHPNRAVQMAAQAALDRLGKHPAPVPLPATPK